MPSVSRRVIFSKRKPASAPPLPLEKPADAHARAKPLPKDEVRLDIPAEEMASRREAMLARVAMPLHPYRPQPRKRRLNSKKLVIYGGSGLFVVLPIMWGLWWVVSSYDLGRYLEAPDYRRPARQNTLDHLSSPRNSSRGSAGTSGYSSGSGSQSASSAPAPTDDSFRATFNVHRRNAAGVTTMITPDGRRYIEGNGDCVVKTNVVNGQLQGLDSCLGGGE